MNSTRTWPAGVEVKLRTRFSQSSLGRHRLGHQLTNPTGSPNTSCCSTLWSGFGFLCRTISCGPFIIWTLMPSTGLSIISAGECMTFDSVGGMNSPIYPGGINIIRKKSPKYTAGRRQWMETHFKCPLSSPRGNFSKPCTESSLFEISLDSRHCSS